MQRLTNKKSGKDAGCKKHPGRDTNARKREAQEQETETHEHGEETAWAAGLKTEHYQNIRTL
jgi:hypothetical protein